MTNPQRLCFVVADHDLTRLVLRRPEDGEFETVAQVRAHSVRPAAPSDGQTAATSASGWRGRQGPRPVGSACSLRQGVQIKARSTRCDPTYTTRLSQALEAAISDGEVNALVLVARPPLLKALCAELGPNGRKAVSGFLRKDFSDTPESVVFRALASCWVPDNRGSLRQSYEGLAFGTL